MSIHARHSFSIIAVCLCTCSLAGAQTLSGQRGMMVYPPKGLPAIQDDIETLGTEWGANLVRWQLVTSDAAATSWDEATYWSVFLAGQLDLLDQIIPVCERVGIRLVIDLHTPPGGRDQDGVQVLFQNPEMRAAYLRVWDHIASRYAGNATVIGYDILNEPGVLRRPRGGMSTRDGREQWLTLAEEVARRIRAVDSAHAIIVEPPYGSPREMKFFRPLPVDIAGVVYSVHMYLPGKFTHQLVPGTGGARRPIRYPNEQLTIEKLRTALKPVRDFQRNYAHRHPEIFVGEFSAVCWAPGKSARSYLDDCILLFEEYGWSWTYHEFRGYNGWSVEHVGSGPDDVEQSCARDSAGNCIEPIPTSRERLLRRAFNRNQ